MPEMDSISHLLEVWSLHDAWAILGELSLWNGATLNLHGVSEQAPEATGHSDLWQIQPFGLIMSSPS